MGGQSFWALGITCLNAVLGHSLVIVTTFLHIIKMIIIDALGIITFNRVPELLGKANHI